MRRSHSEQMQEYRREHNAEMWARAGDPRMDQWTLDLAAYNLKKRLIAAAKLYVEEAGIGE